MEIEQFGTLTVVVVTAVYTWDRMAQNTHTQRSSCNPGQREQGLWMLLLYNSYVRS